MRSFILPAFAALALSACSSPSEAPEAPVDAVAELAGVDLTQPLRASGTEPFWGVDLTGSELVYAGVDRPEQRAPQGQPRLQGTMAVWESVTSTGTPLSVTLTATECSDGMSDRTFPLTALVRIGEETLIGCAAATSATISGGEQDPAQPAA